MIRLLWVALAVSFSMQPMLAQANCSSPSNAIVAENCLPGNPESEWRINEAGDPGVQGFATDISVDAGQTVFFKVKTDATSYRIDIYRIGYYGGNGARKVATVLPTATLPQSQPNCLTEPSTGLIDCGNWSVSASWAVPSTAVSGLYIGRLQGQDGSGPSHMMFVVRNDNSFSDFLYQTSDSTWQAYNDYGGNSLYVGSPAGRAYKVSYNRPFSTASNQFGVHNWWLVNEYPMIRWLERNGYNVSYSTDVDTARRGNELLEHKVFLSVGHDEYWSATQRQNVEAARDAGVSLAFFSGNAIFWKTRWENSIAEPAISHRTIVCYKETLANARIDPSPEWTGTWRDPRFSPPADGGLPENSLMGTLFKVNCCHNPFAIDVSSAEGKLRFWRNTSFASIPPGEIRSTGIGLLGFEWDEAPSDSFAPPGLIRLSTSVRNVNSYLLDFGSTYGSGTATHHLALHRRTNGAYVFGAGTNRWSWGLDGGDHGDGVSVEDPNVQQATVNLFADMGAQPGSLQAGLVPAAASTDVAPPVTSITSPAPGANVSGAVTVTGTGSDVGGLVASVEVSVDGGTVWAAASGTANWTFAFTPAALGPVTIRSRAIDDSGNLETPAAGVTVNSVLPTCPCTIFGPAAVPGTASSGDSGAVELGVKFRTSQAGLITGVRFYKGAANTGTHTGNLWSATGTLLATVTFTGETATGWQQASFASPVAVSANTTYIASYHAPSGGYAFDANYFGTAVVNPPLRALASGEDGGNGVFFYSATSAFPANTFGSTNYWVDAVYVEGGGPNQAPVAVNDSYTTPQGQALTVGAPGVLANDNDPNGNAVSAVKVANPVNGIVTLNGNGGFTYTPNAGYAGADSFTYRANDGSLDSNTATVSITVTAVGGDTIPPVVSSLNDAPATTSAVITWATDEPASARVNYGTSPAALTLTSYRASLQLSHTRTLSGLASATTYYYRVVSIDAAGNAATFPTSANPPLSFTTAHLPSATAVLIGTQLSGNAASLVGNDNNFYQVSSTTSGTRTAAWYGSFASVPAVLSNLSITYRGKNSRSCTESVSIWNWTTNAWIELNSRAVSTGEVVRSNLVPPGSASTYVSAGGEVRVRIQATNGSNSFTNSGESMQILYDIP